MITYIAYSSKDYELAQGLSVELGLLGQDVLFEQKALGSAIRWQEIFTNIEACDVFVMVASVQALDSYSFQLEYRYAKSLHKQIVAVLIEPVDEALLHTYTAIQAYVQWDAYGYSSESIARLLEQLPPIVPGSSIPPVYPDLSRPLEKLRDEVLKLPNSYAAQWVIFSNTREFLEREDTASNASGILRLMQQQPEVAPEIAAEISETFQTLQDQRRRRLVSHRRTRWLRDVALLAAGAIGVLVLVRGFIFLRPYLGLVPAPTPVTTLVSDAALEATESVEPAAAAEQTEEIVSSFIVQPASPTPEPTEPAPPTAPPTPTAAVPDTTQPAANRQATETLVALQQSATASAATVNAVLLARATATAAPPDTEPVNVSDSDAAPSVRYVGVRVEDTPNGVQITEISLSAAQAGIRVGDYLVAVEATAIQSREQFENLMQQQEPSSQVTFRLRRNANELYIRLTLWSQDFEQLTSTAIATNSQ